jgi:4-amino-4-deoxy-L-arabinose transferase-like glycosyltransferase
MELRYKEIIIIFGVLLLLLPLFFERIYDDEAIYWKISKSINEKGLSEVSKVTNMPLAILIVSPLLSISDSILVPRVISVLLALASAILIFEIVKLYSDEKAAFISAMLFIFSFQTIRFATRFYLDIYGVFFFLLSIYLIKKNKLGLAGLSFALAMLSRETWLVLYPFEIVYLWKSKKSIKSFILFSIIPLLLFVIFIYLTAGLGSYLAHSRFSQVASLQNDLYQIPRYLVQSWAEFLVIQIITIMGFVSWILDKKDDFLILILPQFLIVSVIQGFVYNGAMTQYPMGLQASLTLLAGPGIFLIWKKHFKKYPLRPLLISILILQFLLFSYLATVLSLRGASGINDFGYWYDEKVIALLNEKAKNETIVGFHGAFIKDAKEWIWGERFVEKNLEVEPDWYVIIEPKLIKFKTEPENVKYVEVYRIGPYIVLHSHPSGHLHELIEPSKEFSNWALRG